MDYNKLNLLEFANSLTNMDHMKSIRLMIELNQVNI